MNEETFTLDSVPHGPQEVVAREVEPDLYLLLDTNTPSWVIVNNIGREIVSLCNGKRPLREIIKTLCAQYGELYEESIDSVCTFANELKEKHFIREEPFEPPMRLEKNDPLQDIWLNVTNKCNLRCLHCHQSSGLPLKDEMTTEEMCRVICEAEELGAETIYFSGGEPLTRKDILKIIECASQHMKGVILITNGTLITDEIAKKLKDCNVAVQVSLDGASEETHDFIRGKGSHKKALCGLKKLIKAGVLSRMAMTLTKINMNEMDEMIKLTKKLGLKNVHFPIVQSKGRAKENQSLIGIKNENIIAITKKMQEISKNEDIELSVAKALRKEVENGIKKDTCGAGSSTVSIAADGNVYPCAGLHEEEFCAGTIREQSLTDIWKNSEVFKKLRVFSVLDIPECRTCELKFICGSGCHVDKYYAYGMLDTPTPRCKAQQKIYWYLLLERARETQPTF